LRRVRSEHGWVSVCRFLAIRSIKLYVFGSPLDKAENDGAECDRGWGSIYLKRSKLRSGCFALRELRETQLLADGAGFRRVAISRRGKKKCTVHSPAGNNEIFSRIIFAAVGTAV
jgi:hypothetical protein